MTFKDLLKFVGKNQGILVKVLLRNNMFEQVFKNKEDDIHKAYLYCRVIGFKDCNTIVKVVLKDEEDFEEEERLDFPND